MKNMEQYRNEARRCLSWLAATAEEQIGHLQNLGVSPYADELALEFHEVAIQAETRFQEGQISEAEKNELQRLDSMLDAFSGPEHTGLWTAQALSSSGKWREVRTVAGECLRFFQAVD